MTISKPNLILGLAGLIGLAGLRAEGQTPVYFKMLDLTSGDLNRTITLEQVFPAGPLVYGPALANGYKAIVQPVHGEATNYLFAGSYRMSFAGLPAAPILNVYDTTNIIGANTNIAAGIVQVYYLPVTNGGGFSGNTNQFGASGGQTSIKAASLQTNNQFFTSGGSNDIRITDSAGKAMAIFSSLNGLFFPGISFFNLFGATNGAGLATITMAGADGSVSATGFIGTNASIGGAQITSSGIFISSSGGGFILGSDGVSGLYQNGNLIVNTEQIATPGTAATVVNLGLDSSGNVVTNASAIGGSSGTVTSVGISAPGTGLTPGSAVTTSGTLTLSSPSYVVTNNNANSLLQSNSFKIDAKHALSLSNFTAGLPMLLNSDNTVTQLNVGSGLSMAGNTISATGGGSGIAINNGFGTNTFLQYPTLYGDSDSGGSLKIIPSSGNIISYGTNDGSGANLITNSDHSVVLGGTVNVMTNSSFSVIFGGNDNTNDSSGDSGILGGVFNAIQGFGESVILGGRQNVQQGFESAIIAGRQCFASGNWVLAAGRRSRATHTGSFVWSDSQDVDNTDAGADTFNVRARGGVYLNGSPISPTNFCEFNLSTNETSAITTGTAKVSWRAPFAMTLKDCRASLSTASSSGIPTVNIKEGGTTIFTTKLTIDASETTSTTAATPFAFSDTPLADDALITFDIDVAGTGATGLKVKLYYTR